MVIKRDGTTEPFDFSKIINAVSAAFGQCKRKMPKPFKQVLERTFKSGELKDKKGKVIPLTVENIQDQIQNLLFDWDFRDVYNTYLIYRYEHKVTRDYVKSQKEFIERYIHASNNANATVDDNSNVSSKNIGTLNSEIHKPNNITISRGLVMDQLKLHFPEFDKKQYVKDLTRHYIYKHDESTFAGPIAPYCVSASMYPFITNGIKEIGGLSAAPMGLASFCGIYINLIFAISSQFAGAIATSEFLLYFDYFARQEWGDNYYLNPGKVTRISVKHKKTIQEQIHQYFQQVIYSINQPTAARGMQSAFVNFSYFDKPFFEGMFGNFVFPDGTKPQWESLCWLQKEFMKWFNAERLKRVLTFPVESFALVYKDGKFLDQDSADFVAEEYARGHSFFTYISDSVDSLSSCCFEGSEVLKIYTKDGKEFLTTIKDFVDSNNCSIDSAGSRNMKDIYYIDSYNGEDDSTKKTKITGVLKKKYSGKMYKFYTDDRFIEVTADHLIKVKDKEGNILTIPANFLAKHIEEYEIASL